MAKTNFIDANPSQGILGTLVTALFMNKLGIHRHDGLNDDGHCPLDYYTAGGTANALTVTCNPPLTAHIPGMPIYIKAIGDNLGSDVTVKVDSLDTVALKAPARRDLATGNIRKDQIFGMAWDGACYQVITALSEPAGLTFMHPTPTPPPGALERDGALLSRTTYAALFYELVTRPGFTAQTVTCAIASPGVFTKAGHGFAGGERLRLSTTGALPTGINNTSDYFVEMIDANTFYLHVAADLSDARIVTSGTQSGTHSYLQSLYGLGDGSTTFRLPDDRGVFDRGWDHGRGIDAARSLGTEQFDAFKAHLHQPTPDLMYGGVPNVNDYAGNRLCGNGSGFRSASSEGRQIIQSTGASETRPRNRAYLPCITY